MWLALLLPVAQLAVSWHGLSHARAELNRSDVGSPAAAHCDLCLSAAALDGGGLLAATPGLPLATARQALPGWTLSATRLPALVLAYRSRAPPRSLN